MAIKEQFQKLKDNWLLIALIIILIILLNGFSFTPLSAITSKSYAESRGGFAGYADEAMAVERSFLPPYPGVDEDFAPEVEERKITKTASMSTEIKRGNFKEEEANLKNIITTADALIINENVYKTGPKNRQSFSGTYSIRIEENKYESFISQIKQIGELQSFNENARDITGQYLKIEDQLEIEKEKLVLLRQLLEETESTEEKLQLTDRIFNQERLIKSLENSLNQQDLRIDYTSITISLHEKQSDYVNIAIITLGDITRNFVNSINSVIRVIVVIIPYAVAILIIWLVYKRFKKS